MFERTADLYDAIYSFKDYEQEADQIHTLIGQHKRAPSNDLLDIACGTGKHLAYLQAHYSCEGMDLDEGMGSAFRERHQGIPFHRGDMADFDLGQKYGSVICLFGSIGYAATRERLFLKIARMSTSELTLDAWLLQFHYLVGRQDRSSTFGKPTRWVASSTTTIWQHSAQRDSR